MRRSEMIGPDWRLGRALNWLQVASAAFGLALALIWVAVWPFLIETGLYGRLAYGLVIAPLPLAFGLAILPFAAVTAGFGIYWLVLYAVRLRHGSS